MDKTTAAIVVSYDHYLNSAWARGFVENRGPYASVVLLVDDPAPDIDFNEFYEWNVVISNAKGIPPLEFRVAAMAALSNHSNLYPAIVLDELHYQEVYAEAGVLVVLDR